jgi:AraC family transcriptional regulator
MNLERTANLYPPPLHFSAPPYSARSVEVMESSAAKGEWTVPAFQEVTLGLALSDFSASWRGIRGQQSQHVGAGTLAICELNQPKTFAMRSDANFAIVLLRRDALEQVGQEAGFITSDLEAHEAIDDFTLRHIIELLFQEKRDGFQNGSLFVDSLGTALASHLLHHYSIRPLSRRNSAGGMAPSALRRCIALMEANIERDLRLSELANEAGVSTSHFIRSFRESTGKTPYQFLLHQRVTRAQSLMREPGTSLTEVALASGFADQHHLARVFRRITRMTPSDYRRSL